VKYKVIPPLIQCLYGLTLNRTRRGVSLTTHFLAIEDGRARGDTPISKYSSIGAKKLNLLLNIYGAYVSILAETGQALRKFKVYILPAFPGVCS
jgi:hypothetical protein